MACRQLAVAAEAHIGEGGNGIGGRLLGLLSLGGGGETVTLVSTGGGDGVASGGGACTDGLALRI